MKKKFRTIIVDGENWAWTFHAKDDYYDVKYLKIWKDKKIVFEKSWSYQYGSKYSRKRHMTPAIVSRFIKRFLKK